MKKKLILCVALLLFVFGFIGCGNYDGGKTNAPETTPDEDVKVYSALIDLLRNEIETLKKEQSISDAEYEARIAELQKKLDEAISEGNGEENTDTPPEKSPFTYEIQNEEAVITGYSGTHSVLIIPDTIDGYTVTAISDSVFAGKTSLTSVSLPKNLKKLGWFAFSGCTSLKSANLPQSLSDIGYDAFANCSKLTIYCEKGSYAEKFAGSYGISCVAN